MSETPTIPTPNDLPKPDAVIEPATEEPTETPVNEETVEQEETKAEKTFTQEEVNSIVSKRVAELNGKMAELEAAIKAQTEQPETHVEDTAIKEALQEAQSALQAANQAAVQAKLEAAVTTAAIKAGVTPDKVGFVQKLADVTNAVGEDGAVDGEAVSSAVAQVLEGLPELAVPKAVGAGPRIAPKTERPTLDDLISKRYGGK